MSKKGDDRDDEVHFSREERRHRGLWLSQIIKLIRNLRTVRTGSRNRMYVIIPINLYVLCAMYGLKQSVNYANSGQLSQFNQIEKSRRTADLTLFVFLKLPICLKKV